MYYKHCMNLASSIIGGFIISIFTKDFNFMNVNFTICWEINEFKNGHW